MTQTSEPKNLMGRFNRNSFASAPMYTVFYGPTAINNPIRLSSWDLFELDNPVSEAVAHRCGQMQIEYLNVMPQICDDRRSDEAADDWDAAIAYLNGGGALVKLPDDEHSKYSRLYVMKKYPRILQTSKKLLAHDRNKRPIRIGDKVIYPTKGLPNMPETILRAISQMNGQGGQLLLKGQVADPKEPNNVGRCWDVFARDLLVINPDVINERDVDGDLIREGDELINHRRGQIIQAVACNVGGEVRFKGLVLFSDKRGLVGLKISADFSKFKLRRKAERDIQPAQAPVREETPEKLPTSCRKCGGRTKHLVPETKQNTCVYCFRKAMSRKEAGPGIEAKELGEPYEEETAWESTFWEEP